MGKMKQRVLSLALALAMVLAGVAAAPEKRAKAAGVTPTASSNVDGHEYGGWSRWMTPIWSYLDYVDGKYQRVEYTSSKLIVETFDASFNCVSSKEITMELPIFGGYFCGKDANYVVFGQNNTAESDSTEVFRVVKYDRSWKKLGAASLKGANTYAPFEASTVRMDEGNGYLAIRTGHKMYKSSDGYNHQANVTMIVREKDMQMVDSFYSVANEGVGYSSHSFNQFVKVDGGKIVCVDHGDAYPRAVMIGKYQNNIGSTNLKNWESYTRTYALKIPGSTGDNTTGVQVGGFEVSSSGYLICGNRNFAYGADSMGDYNSSKNVFVEYTDKNLSSVKDVQLTSYSESGVHASNPYLVKLSDTLFMVLWQKLNTKDCIYYAFFDGKGKQLGSTGSVKGGALSECQPKLMNGKVTWYVTNSSVKNGQPVLYQLTPNETKYTASLKTLPTDKKSIKTLKVSAIANKVYTGSAVKPKLVIKDGSKALAEGTDYTVKYANNVNVGLATVTITGKGSYTGSVSKSFKIIPKNVTESTIKATTGKKSIKFGWAARKLKMKTERITGYQLQCSTDSGFTKNKKLVSVKGCAKISGSITGLKTGTYYVRMRTYMKTGGTTYYSKWSTVKKVKVK